ncbi:hypothetical protein [Pseudomonas sp. zjy_8]|uniref:hypothetical protein n=1 Tax=Pseudomonas sp. GLN_2 TaxID=3367180 RepID=UPI00370A7A56
MDKQAKNILFKTYWGSNGWLPAPKTDPQDFAYAKAQGLMFEPASIGHDQCLDEVLDMIMRIPPAKAARAFVASLSRRRLDWRSGVASYHLACQMVPHQYTPTVCGHSYLPDGTLTTTSYTCAVCRDVVPGLTVGEDQYTDVDLNVLNFERIKWGGVRHGQLIYTWFDLQELLRDDIPNPTEEDLAILRAILGIIDLSKPGDHAGSLEKRLADVVKSSKNERRVIIDVLAHLGVLKPASFERPIHSRSDWSEAAACWRGEDKFDHEAVCKHFGRWLQTEVNH